MVVLYPLPYILRVASSSQSLHALATRRVAHCVALLRSTTREGRIGIEERTEMICASQLSRRVPLLVPQLQPWNLLRRYLLLLSLIFSFSTIPPCYLWPVSYFLLSPHFISSLFSLFSIHSHYLYLSHCFHCFHCFHLSHLPHLPQILFIMSIIIVLVFSYSSLFSFILFILLVLLSSYSSSFILLFISLILPKH